ncbi:MAG: helix-turn-helix transcriptional regulator [Planctomycetes bacterium]|nr:helix-turn-helix transcriptional regulator [Planctomycetota bacterium]
MIDNSRYSWDLLPQLNESIEHARSEQAHADLKTLLDIVYQQSEGDLVLCKMRCSSVMASGMRSARLGGAPSTQVLQEHINALKQLSRLATWPSCKRKMHCYLTQLLAHVDSDEQGRMQRIVQHIREDLREQIHNTRSLSQYAQELEMSDGHLSRSFTEIVGHPFSEEIRFIRCERAKELLLQTAYKIQDMCTMIGLASPSQFISDFRSLTNLTPGAYRRQFKKK